MQRVQCAGNYAIHFNVLLVYHLMSTHIWNHAISMYYSGRRPISSLSFQLAQCPRAGQEDEKKIK